MSFDNVEEQQDPTTLPSRMRRDLYPFAGGVPPIENKPSGLEPVDVPSESAPTFNFIQPTMRVAPGAQSSKPEYSQPLDPPKIGIGHRILALGKASVSPLETQLQPGPGRGAQPVGKQGIGHRILASGQQGDGTQMSPPPIPLSIVPQPNIGFNRLERNQGFFVGFVPSGADRSAGYGAQSPLSAAGVNRGSSPNISLGMTNGSMGFSRFTRTALPFGQNGLNSVRSGSGARDSDIGKEEAQVRSQIRPEQQSRTHQLSPPKPTAHSGQPHTQRGKATQRIPPPPVSDIQAYIRQQASAYGIPEALALGLVNKESHFDANARGSLDEVGLFQILPPRKGKTLVGEDASGKRFTIDMNRAASDWQYNVRAGMALLRRAYRQAQASTPNDVIAATYAHYNGGDKNWVYYTRKNAPVHYHIYGQWIKQHGKPIYVEGYMDFYDRWSKSRWSQVYAH